MRARKSRGAFRSFFETMAGSGAVVAGAAGVVEVFLPRRGPRERLAEEVAARHPEAVAESELSRLAAELLTRYFAGERVFFSLPLDLEGCTPFVRRVYGIVAAVPYGEVRTYAEVAAAAGSPGAARAVGRAMATNRAPVIMPCHRVVGSRGEMTGFSAEGGVEAKRELLALEGVLIAPGGNVKAVFPRIVGHLYTGEV